MAQENFATERDELLDSLCEVVRTACGNDSASISAYADAMRVLSAHGRCRIVKEFPLADRIIVEWIL
jgi:hypothetical protein